VSRPRPRAFDSELVKIGRVRVRVRVEGDGPALLLLNGFLRPLESWAPITRALSGHTIVTFDAPGVGGSPTPLYPLSMSTLARLAVSVLDEVGVDTADVLGYSHGGGVAQQLAVDAPDRLRRLVLVSTSCGLGATPGNQGALNTLRRPAAARDWPLPDPMGALWQVLAISAWTSIPFLAAIRAPTLAVCGAHDRVVPPANSRLLAQRIPGAELVIIPGGHDVQCSPSAKALVNAIEPFLSAGRLPAQLQAAG
jgi:poly(3-hydroxyoctanoate) depolymerase